MQRATAGIGVPITITYFTGDPGPVDWDFAGDMILKIVEALEETRELPPEWFRVEIGTRSGEAIMFESENAPTPFVM